MLYLISTNGRCVILPTFFCLIICLSVCLSFYFFCFLICQLLLSLGQLSLFFNTFEQQGHKMAQQLGAHFLVKKTIWWSNHGATNLLTRPNMSIWPKKGGKRLKTRVISPKHASTAATLNNKDKLSISCKFQLFGKYIYIYIYHISPPIYIYI